MLFLENQVAIPNTNNIRLKLNQLGVTVIQSTVSNRFGHEIY